LPGGENYREVLLILPVREPDFSVDDFIDKMATKYGKEAIYDIDGNLSVIKPDFPKMLSAEDQAKYEATVLNARPDVKPYRTHHWDQENILAHIRVNDRYADGNKVLFVEEIQSDWGQEGKKKGFASSGKLPEGWSVHQDKRTGQWYVIDKTNTQTGLYADTKEEAIVNATGSKTLGVPLAPFVTKTEGWLNLALKRIMIMAAEGGYDKVAFVNGEQSADRYDLSRQVDKIVWNEKTGDFAAQRSGGDTGTIKHKEVTKEKLADLIGKEPAERLIKAKELSGWRTIEGDDLKVGGEGMKTFYDKIVPTTLKKLLPKVGGGEMIKVENDY
jgi:hypothetical protein